MNLAQMVIRLVAENRQYKADLSDAAKHTQSVAADVVQSTGKMEKAATALGDRLGVNRELSERAGAAVSQMAGSYAGAGTAVGVLAAGLAAYVVIAKAAAAETQRQADALTLTGNAAGLVSGQLNQMAREASAQIHGQVGDMRSTMETLVASGRVSQASLGEVAKGVELVARFSGQSREAVAKDFASMASDVTAWAAKHNEQYHYLTLDQYKYIESLQKAGDVQRAMAVNADMLAKSLGGDLTKNLGYLQKAWAGVQTWASRAWDAMLNMGREKSTTEKLKAVQDEIEALSSKKNPNRGTAYRDAQVAAARLREAGLQEELKFERRAADEKAAIAAKSEADIKKYRDDQKAKGAKEDPNRAIDAEIAALKAGEAAKAEIVKQGLDTIASERKRGVISESDALQQTVALQLQALGAKRETVEAELALSKKKANSQKEQATLQGQIAAIEEQQRTLGIKYANDYLELLTKGNLAAAEAHHKYIDSLERGLAKMEQDAAAQSEHNARLGLSKQAIADLDAAKLRSQAVTLELMAVKQLDKNLDEEQYRLYMAQAKALRDLAAAKQTGAAKEAGIEAEKAIAEEARRTAETVERTLTDALMRGFEAGKSFAVNMRDAVVNLFKTLVLRPIIQGVVVGALGLPGAASANGTASGGGLGGLINMGKSVYNMMTDSNGWFQNFGGAAGGSIADFGTSLVDKGFTKLGTSIESFGLNIGSVSSTINTLGNGLGYLNGIVAMSKGKWGEGLGSMIGTYFGGPLGAMLGSKIGSWIDSLTGGGTKPSIEGGFSTMGNPGTNGRTYRQGDGGLYYGGALDQNTKALVTGTTADYNTIVKATGHTGGTFTSAAFMGLDGNGGAKGSKNALDFSASLNGRTVYNRFADLGTNAAGTTNDEMTAASKEASAKAVLAALAETDLGPQLNKYLDSVKINGASLAEVTASLGDVTNYIAFSDAVKSLPFDYLKDISVEASKALITAAGGLEQLGQNIGNYFELFGTDAEKQSAKVGSLSSSFAALGITMPKSNEGLREWYKSEVKRLGAMDLSVQANADAYNSILKLANGVDDLASSAEQTAATRQSWQDKLNLLNGTTTQAELDLRRDLASTTDEGTQALIRQYYAQKATKEATEATTAALKAAAESQQNWQDQLDVLTGSATQDQIAERKALAAATDDGSKALIRQYYAEKARQKALSDAESRRSAAIEAAKSAVDRAAAAERTRAQALVQVAQENVNALTGLFDLLASNIKDLYSQVDSTRAMSAAAGQQFIEQALTTANATGYLPDQKTLAEAISAVRDGFDQTVYASQFEQDRARLVLAGELAQLKAKAGTQLTTAEKQLAVAQEQLSGIDAMVEAAQRQIDAINGVDNSIGDLSTAINAWIAANAQKAATGSTSSGSFTAPTVSAPATAGGDPPVIAGSSGGAVFGGTPTGTTAASSASTVLLLGLASGNGPGTTAAGGTYVPSSGGAVFGGSVRAYADGGLHAGGLRLVGERGPELEVTGPARYWDATTTAAMFSGARLGAGQRDAAAAIDALREDMRRQALAMMMELVEMRRIYKSWEMVGLPATRTAVPA